ncbi:hypothetical protein M885DRAFT_541073 [Pelagophyceae sp. CCMP2097]|nr:hypothetical protein M885DRAFT_541073 [Pelagophyceae sp. CCMP2097]
MQVLSDLFRRAPARRRAGPAEGAAAQSDAAAGLDTAAGLPPTRPYSRSRSRDDHDADVDHYGLALWDKKWSLDDPFVASPKYGDGAARECAGGPERPPSLSGSLRQMSLESAPEDASLDYMLALESVIRPEDFDRDMHQTLAESSDDNSDDEARLPSIDEEDAPADGSPPSPPPPPRASPPPVSRDVVASEAPGPPTPAVELQSSPRRGVAAAVSSEFSDVDDPPAAAPGAARPGAVSPQPASTTKKPSSMPRRPKSRAEAAQRTQVPIAPRQGAASAPLSDVGSAPARALDAVARLVAAGRATAAQAAQCAEVCETADPFILRHLADAVDLAVLGDGKKLTLVLSIHESTRADAAAHGPPEPAHAPPEQDRAAVVADLEGRAEVARLLAVDRRTAGDVAGALQAMREFKLHQHNLEHLKHPELAPC